MTSFFCLLYKQPRNASSKGSHPLQTLDLYTTGNHKD
jgi:hypothetical protein